MLVIHRREAGITYDALLALQQDGQDIATMLKVNRQTCHLRMWFLIKNSSKNKKWYFKIKNGNFVARTPALKEITGCFSNHRKITPYGNFDL